ncbi:MAG: hypothetical protein U0X39_02190 [Bacteroidales bacterium]
MAVETERKFLVTGEYKHLAYKKVRNHTRISLLQARRLLSVSGFRMRQPG